MDEYLYHYTSLQTLTYLQDWRQMYDAYTDTIADTGEKEKDARENIHLKFSATRFSCLNDSTEYEKVTSFKSCIEKKAHEIAWGGPYVLSLSKNKDDLSMWNMYGDQCRGVCLKFKKNDIEEFVNSSKFLYMKECEYKESQSFESAYNEIVNNSGDFDFIQENFTKMTEFAKEAIALKNSCFNNENEWRIVRFCEHFYMRQAKAGIVPCVDIELPMSCMEEIVIGPLASKLAKMQVEAWVDQYNRVSKGHLIGVNNSKITLQ